MAVPKCKWIPAGVILCGLLLRIVWVVACPPIQISDFAVYMGIARNFLATHSYVEGGMFQAYTAPGEPAFMVAGIDLVGDHWWMPTLLNLGCYVLLSLLAAMLARNIGGDLAGIFTAILLAVWPCYVGITGLAASEHPSTVLFFVACLLLFFPARWAPLCGVAGGLAALVRPNMMLLPVLWAAGALLSAQRPIHLKKALWPTLVATACMLLTIAPWTIRNYRVLHAFVPISTNGGDVFYRANNPLATGSWTYRGEVDLYTLYSSDEVKWNRVSYAYGERWIASHPIGFLKLAIRKSYYFLYSDDAAYWPLARTYPLRIHAWRVLQIVDNIWWRLLLLAAVISAVLHWNEVAIKLLTLPFLYLLAIHSVFESQGRYHIPGVPFLIILAAVGLSRWVRSKNAEHPLSEAPK